MAQTLFGGSSGTHGAGVSADLLARWASAKAGVGVQIPDVGADPNAPLAPVWQPGLTPGAEALVDRAFNNKSFFDINAKLYSDLGATGDYRKLFALHSGLSTMQALAGKLQDEKISATQKKATEAQFARGIAELESFFTKETFEDVRLAQGDRVDSAQTSLAIPSTTEDYVTGIIHRGTISATLTSLDPNAKFDIVATSAGGTERRVAIDLAQMGSIPRSLSNVVSFINNKLSAAGAASRFAAVDQTPKTQSITIAGQTITSPYKGAKTWALKVDVNAGERVAFEPVAATPAFYTIGQTSGGARLIKLEDVDGDAAQAVFHTRPDATIDASGAYVETGWLGPGGVYGGAPAEAYEKRTNAMVSDGVNNVENALKAAGEAVLKLTLADGRTVSVSTAWRAGDLEAWRVRTGETADHGMLDDLSERLTQLLHEQGVAAGVDMWSDADEAGLSIFTGDFVTASSLTISGKAVALEAGADPAGGMVGGLRAGVFARRYEAAGVAGAGSLFYEDQTITVTTAEKAHTITIDGGSSGVGEAEFVQRLNDALREKGLAASADLIDNAGVLTLRMNGLHDLTDFSAALNTTAIVNTQTFDADRVAPGASVLGGLPLSASGEPFGDAVRTYNASASPLLTHAGALDIAIVVATPSGNKTINVSVTAGERSGDPDPSPGEWSQAFQDRLDAALSEAGVYVGAHGADLSSWSVAEGFGQRIQSITINGDAVALTGETPSLGLGGAFSAERSFTSAQAATGVSDPIAALISDPNVSITFETAWGSKTVSASLEAGDPRTMESAALRLNEALAAQGYDLGVAAVPLAGGAGLRIVSGASHSIRNVSTIALGASNTAITLDPIDSVSQADDPALAAGVASRAARGAAITETIPSANTPVAPSAAASGWFAGRAFDVGVGGGAKVATARAVATGADGSVFVLADLSGDSATLPIKGARDVALFKYDSAGKLALQRILGATESANGYALAVSSDGKVAVAGSVEGELRGAGAARGGTDSFVSVFDADGDALWTARRGASANDEARAIAFAPDGSVIVTGKTDSALGSALALGAADAYVRGYSASGLELFTKQFGTTAADAATALLVRDDGSGGAEIFTGGVENNRGVVRRFTYSSGGGLVAGATRDIGYFHKGAINALVADGANLYVGGEIGADRLSLGPTARGAVSDQEGFVARIDADLSSTALDRATYLGSAKDDAVRGLAIVDGDIYAAGETGVIAGQGAAAAKQGFLARLDDDGAIAWTRAFSSAGGAPTMAGLAVDTGGASPLDVLGLPRGVVQTRDSAKLVDRGALRAGDEFKIGADDRRLSTITIAANETMGTLLGKINRAIGAAGQAKLVKEDGAERIKIIATEGHAVRLGDGRDGRDALSGLGLNEGMIAVKTTEKGALRAFGLGLNGDALKLDTKAAIVKSKAEISAAISIVRQAYEALAHPNAKEPTEAEKALEARKAGAAPAYLNAQYANYRAALLRLGG